MRILLTGRPGIGKTTIVKRFLEQFKGVCTGFYTEAIEEAGQRCGFQVSTLAGRQGLLAHKDLKTGPRVGRYRVHVAEFESIALPSLQPSSESALVIIDEIGKMEWYSHRFQERVAALFEGPNPLLATIPQHPMPFTSNLKNRPDVEFLEVSKANRDGLPARLLKLLRPGEPT